MLKTSENAYLTFEKKRMHVMLCICLKRKDAFDEPFLEITWDLVFSAYRVLHFQLFRILLIALNSIHLKWLVALTECN